MEHKNLGGEGIWSSIPQLSSYSQDDQLLCGVFL